ncbi:MAG: hypothetical protein ACT4RN_23195 [Pseudonocardia sp.]
MKTQSIEATGTVSEEAEVDLAIEEIEVSEISIESLFTRERQDVGH